MKIGIDLEGTLIAQCGEFSGERTTDLARLILKSNLRHGAKELLRDLRRARHTIVLYSSGDLSARKLMLWCRLAGLPVQKVVTVGLLRKKARQSVAKSSTVKPPVKSAQISWPPCEGMDLILDDNPRNVQAAWQKDVRGILITNQDRDWTAGVRMATLQNQDIEVLSRQAV